MKIGNVFFPSEIVVGTEPSCFLRLLSWRRFGFSGRYDGRAPAWRIFAWQILHVFGGDRSHGLWWKTSSFWGRDSSACLLLAEGLMNGERRLCLSWWEKVFHGRLFAGERQEPRIGKSEARKIFLSVWDQQYVFILPGAFKKMLLKCGMTMLRGPHVWGLEDRKAKSFCTHRLLWRKWVPEKIFGESGYFLPCWEGGKRTS